MKIINYQPEYEKEVYRLWNSAGASQGFISMEYKLFKEQLIKHPYFTKEHAFLLIKDDTSVCGFTCGCEGDNLPRGKERGYFTCLLLEREENTQENTELLLEALEKSFRKKGKTQIVSNFFNPMRLQWIIEKEQNRVHNNAPGIAIDLPLFKHMEQFGYQNLAQECAMYLDLDRLIISKDYEEKKTRALEEGYSIEWYDKHLHTKLVPMVDSLGNPQWSVEIPYAAENINMLVAVKENEVVGFTGPVYPEDTGRGYFAGIAVSASHEKHGLGTLLFLRLCQEEKKAGAKYMSLFTGSDNHAQRIYRNAGFNVKRIFSVMAKELL